MRRMRSSASCGSSASRSIQAAKFGQNQFGKLCRIWRIVSAFGSRARPSRAPPQPDPFEMVIAKRSSCAPVQSAVLPPRLCPRTATRVASSSGRDSIQSMTREFPHAHAPIVPQPSAARTTFVAARSPVATWETMPTGQRKSVFDHRLALGQTSLKFHRT